MFALGFTLVLALLVSYFSALGIRELYWGRIGRPRYLARRREQEKRVYRAFGQTPPPDIAQRSF
jgi:hypothetical protein